MDEPFVFIFIISFIVSLLITKLTIQILKDKKAVGKDFGLVVPDLHEKDKPLVPRLGGFGVFAGILAGLLICSFYHETALFAAFLTILLIAIIGFVDDLFGVSEVWRVVFPMFAAIPLALTQIGYIILIPFGVTGASNATNMLAGFKGLGSGLGLISCSALLVVALHLNAIPSALLLIATIGALLAFWFYNVQGKIFPGATNYIIGAVMACAVIMGEFELIGIIIIAPYFIELILKVRSGFRVKWWGILQEDGTLKPASERIVSLPQLLMKHQNLTERKLVLELYGIQVCVCIVAVLIGVIL